MSLCVSVMSLCVPVMSLCVPAMPLCIPVMCLSFLLCLFVFLLCLFVFLFCLFLFLLCLFVFLICLSLTSSQICPSHLFFDFVSFSLLLLGVFYILYRNPLFCFVTISCSWYSFLLFPVVFLHSTSEVISGFCTS